MRNPRAFFLFSIALLTVVSALLLLRAQDSALSKAELATNDLLARHARPAPVNDKLVFLAIDSDSVNLGAESDLDELFALAKGESPERSALSLMSQSWPWSREVYALVLDRLMRAGARVVVFDLLFPKPAEGDDALAYALAQYSDRVVIGSNFNSALDEAGRLSASVTVPCSSLIHPANGPDSRVGLVNFWPDSDETVRSARFHARYSELLGARIPFGELHTSLAGRALEKLGRCDLVPADTENHPFRFAAGPQGFPARSIFEIFAPEYWARNYRSGAVFKDAVVVVGAAGNWQHDQHPTPYGVMAGPEIQLNVINAALQQDFLRPCSFWGQLAVLAIAGLAAVLITLFTSSPLLRCSLFLGASVLAFALVYWLFNQFGLLLPFVAPVAILATIAIAGLIFDLCLAGAEQLHLRRRVWEQQLAEEILAQANAELEVRVQDRTAELTLANTTLTGLVEEKNVLLKEIHHRVKNNMQVISSLLNLQSDHIQDPVAIQVFAESRNRVRSMALIHEKLYQSSDLAKINFGDYLKTLTYGLASGYAGKVSGVRITTESDEVMLGVDAAVPCGLIVNELVTNCFKYAFPAGRTGGIQVAVRRIADGKLQLSVADDGIGFPKTVDFRATESLGLQLVNTLSEQIEAELTMRNGCGTTFEITFQEQT